MKKKLFITVLGLFFIASIMSFEESDSQNFQRVENFGVGVSGIAQGMSI